MFMCFWGSFVVLKTMFCLILKFSVDFSKFYRFFLKIFEGFTFEFEVKIFENFFFDFLAPRDLRTVLGMDFQIFTGTAGRNFQKWPKTTQKVVFCLSDKTFPRPTMDFQSKNSIFHENRFFKSYKSTSGRLFSGFSSCFQADFFTSETVKI